MDQEDRHVEQLRERYRAVRRLALGEPGMAHRVVARRPEAALQQAPGQPFQEACKWAEPDDCAIQRVVGPRRVMQLGRVGRDDQPFGPPADAAERVLNDDVAPGLPEIGRYRPRGRIVPASDRSRQDEHAHPALRVPAQRLPPSPRTSRNG